jgi:hypothetical protein
LKKCWAWGAILCFSVLAGSSAKAQSDAAHKAERPQLTREDPLKEYTIVRCLFQERRLVLRRGGQLFVLHQGDSLPGSKLVVSSISASQAILKETGNESQMGANVPMALGPVVMISEQSNGRVDVKIVYGSRLDAPLTKAMPPSDQVPRSLARESKEQRDSSESSTPAQKPSPESVRKP